MIICARMAKEISHVAVGMAIYWKVMVSHVVVCFLLFGPSVNALPLSLYSQTSYAYENVQI